MQYPSLIGHCAELCRIIKKSSQPADVVASDYLRSRKYIGSNDRKFISELCFFTLRALSLVKHSSDSAWSNIQYLVTDENVHEIGIICSAMLFGDLSSILIFDKEKFNIPDSSEVIRTVLMEKCGIEDKEVTDVWYETCKSKNIYLFNILSGAINDDELHSTAFCLPEWIINSLKESGKSYNEIRELALSLLYPAPFTIRVRNPIRNREKVSAMLTKENIVNNYSTLSPAGLTIQKRVSLIQHSLYKEGIIEIQDEGSQLISYALAPEESDRVLDACAGAGGKTLHIADIQYDKGSIVATDIEYKRLKEISLRAARAGYNSIRSALIENADKTQKKQHNKKTELFDAVLVDAPCSGLGTIRRMPMAKWRANPALISKLATKQLAILEHNAQSVKEGGVILYATCSLLPQENDKVAKTFLERNKNFAPVPLQTSFDKFGITIDSLKTDDNTLSLYPSVHGSDGFFMAKFKRIT